MHVLIRNSGGRVNGTRQPCADPCECDPMQCSACELPCIAAFRREHWVFGGEPLTIDGRRPSHGDGARDRRHRISSHDGVFECGRHPTACAVEPIGNNGRSTEGWCQACDGRVHAVAALPGSCRPSPAPHRIDRDPCWAPTQPVERVGITNGVPRPPPAIRHVRRGAQGVDRDVRPSVHPRTQWPAAWLRRPGEQTPQRNIRTTEEVGGPRS